MLNSRNLTVFKRIRLFLKSDSSTFAENVRYLMYKYEIPIFVCYFSHSVNWGGQCKGTM